MQGDERIDLRSVERFIRLAVEAGAINRATAFRLRDLARSLGAAGGAAESPSAPPDLRPTVTAAAWPTLDAATAFLADPARGPAAAPRARRPGPGEAAGCVMPCSRATRLSLRQSEGPPGGPPRRCPAQPGGAPASGPARRPVRRLSAAAARPSAAARGPARPGGAPPARRAHLVGARPAPPGEAAPGGGQRLRHPRDHLPGGVPRPGGAGRLLHRRRLLRPDLRHPLDPPVHLRALPGLLLRARLGAAPQERDPAGGDRHRADRRGAGAGDGGGPLPGRLQHPAQRRAVVAVGGLCRLRGSSPWWCSGCWRAGAGSTPT